MPDSSVPLASLPDWLTAAGVPLASLFRAANARAQASTHSDELKASTADAFRGAAALSGSGYHDIGQGDIIGGVPKVALGSLAGWLSPLTGATETLVEKPLTQLTGNPDFGTKAGFLAGIPELTMPEKLAMASPAAMAVAGKYAPWMKVEEAAEPAVSLHPDDKIKLIEGLYGDAAAQKEASQHAAWAESTHRLEKESGFWLVKDPKAREEMGLPPIPPGAKSPADVAASPATEQGAAQSWLDVARGKNSQPLLRDVTARGRSGRPLQSAGFSPDADEQILKAGYERATAPPAAKIAGEGTDLSRRGFLQGLGSMAAATAVPKAVTKSMIHPDASLYAEQFLGSGVTGIPSISPRRAVADLMRSSQENPELAPAYRDAARLIMSGWRPSPRMPFGLSSAESTPVVEAQNPASGAAEFPDIPKNTQAAPAESAPAGRITFRGSLPKTQGEVSRFDEYQHPDGRIFNYDVHYDPQGNATISNVKVQKEVNGEEGAYPAHQHLDRADLQSVMNGIAAQEQQVIGERAAGVHDISRAKNAPMIYNPPVQEPRPFEADYPQGAQLNEQGRFATDIEGRPLTAQYVAGRSDPQSADVSLLPHQVAAIGRGAVGARLEGRPGSSFPEGELGLYEGGTGSAGQRRISYSTDLPPEQQDRIIAHEVGHGLENTRIGDELWSQGGTLNIPEHIEGQMRQVYHDLNGGKPGMSAWAGPMKPRPEGAVTPETRGYRPHQVDRELWAENIRAYMADPNYYKTVAPDAAKLMRRYFNSHPETSRHVQFNALPLAAMLGGGALAAHSGHVPLSSLPQQQQ